MAMHKPFYYREKDALVTATYLHELWVFEHLVADGADLNCKDDIGQTPLHAAADRGWEDLVMRLLDLGADLNIEDLAGDTPLDIALFREHSHVAVLLESRAEKSVLTPPTVFQRQNSEPGRVSMPQSEKRFDPCESV
jgi:ankyrin repeat protein